MEVEMVGGPYAGKKYKVHKEAKYLVVPLPKEEPGKPFTISDAVTLDPTYEVKNLLINKVYVSGKMQYFAVWDEIKQFEYDKDKEKAKGMTIHHDAHKYARATMRLMEELFGVETDYEPEKMQYHFSIAGNTECHFCEGSKVYTQEVVYEDVMGEEKIEHNEMPCPVCLGKGTKSTEIHTIITSEEFELHVKRIFNFQFRPPPPSTSAYTFQNEMLALQADLNAAKIDQKQLKKLWKELSKEAEQLSKKPFPTASEKVWNPNKSVF